ncbi:DUF397 domain-containing protein [Streptomyces niveiscabiei]|uniref:DUF397 domain-containing protein n=1 Tax=Streptomyces niveiscabiei TaxID=164115 RepID=UPI003EB8F861
MPSSVSPRPVTGPGSPSVPRGCRGRGRSAPRSPAHYIALEWDASDLYVVETGLIPGLLQTPAYTEAVIREQRPDKADGFDYVNEQVKVRGQRRQVFARNAPLRLWAILAEASLRHRVGGPDVMREQLGHLAAQAAEANIQVQVLPGEASINSALHGPFGILAFPEHVETDVVYADGLIDTVYYEEPAQVEIHGTHPPRHTGNGRRLAITHFPNAAATGFDWFKSSHSSGDQSCLETAAAPGIVPVRDSNNSDGPALVLTPSAWGFFVNHVKK